jgi:hypothetical protein
MRCQSWSSSHVAAVMLEGLFPSLVPVSGLMAYTDLT